MFFGKKMSYLFLLANIRSYNENDVITIDPMLKIQEEREYIIELATFSQIMG